MTADFCSTLKQHLYISVHIVQFVWSTGLGCLYIIHSLLLYYCADDPEYQILYEETLDWGNYPTTSLIVVISVSFVVMPLSHTIQFLIFMTRQYFLRSSTLPDVNIEEADSGSDLKLSNKVDLEIMSM